MSFKYISKMPTVEEIRELIPLSPELAKLKKERDAEIKAVFEGKSDKFVLVIGPCSADNEKAIMEYIIKLAGVNEQVKDKLVLIPRIYTNKPRTTGEGYKGMYHQPDPTKEPDLIEGLKAIRTTHIKAISESGLSPADEMLYPNNYPYVEDLLSYIAIGARSVENQQHRLTVSGVDCPAGMKNPTSGDLSVMFNAILAAQVKHIYEYNGNQVETSGNPYAHAILRGYVDSEGKHRPNYHYENLLESLDIYKQKDLVNPAIVVDTNHSNSGKKYLEQPRIAMDIIRSMHYNPELKGVIKGLMIESYLEDGAQKIGENVYGKSITDPCLGWEKTEKLIMDIAEKL